MLQLKSPALKGNFRNGNRCVKRVCERERVCAEVLCRMPFFDETRSAKRLGGEEFVSCLMQLCVVLPLELSRSQRSPLARTLRKCQEVFRRPEKVAEIK